MSKTSDAMEALSWEDRKTVRRLTGRRTIVWTILPLVSFTVAALIRALDLPAKMPMGLLFLAIAAAGIWICIHKRKRVMWEIVQQFEPENKDDRKQD